jgi:phage terminase large subunit-like protein
MVKAAWFRSYAPNERPDKFDRVVQSWDTAKQGDQAQRFQCVHELGDQGQGPLPVARAAQAHGISRAEAGGARAVPAFAASVVLIEDKASGPS